MGLEFFGLALSFFENAQKRAWFKQSDFYENSAVFCCNFVQISPNMAFLEQVKSVFEVLFEKEWPLI